ncbi:hypothetical protein [Lysobacter capsici]|uniref:hypothetical protein n=1 Tax=Lysobacter capsici TaxID=435897 RepID=UPI001C0022C0|nr:hypothetical protein [Lysobacter capsici]QWF18144.1 hypothetical protein KME82_05090 [Lysobacter capsici]
MSWGNDQDLESRDEEYKESRADSIRKMAAIYIIMDELSEKSALSKAEAVFNAQDEAKDDETGVGGTLAEAQWPEMPIDEIKRRQIFAVIQKLEKKDR